MLDPEWGRTPTGWCMQPCCRRWLHKHEAPTKCPECGTEFVLTADFEVWPAHLLIPPAVLGMKGDEEN